MAVGQRKSQRPDELWIAKDEIVRGSGHPFDRRLKAIFDEARIDRWVQGRYKRFYAKEGAAGQQPGVYLRSARGVALALGARDRACWDASISLPDCSATKPGRVSE